ncbi:Maf family protein [Pigmentibacter ruber]|uniref:Maf family protein n=1 Tax=Pigmentibacter ruber TaxID=2683196 RepID=UPI00131DA1A6|nr:Maf family protein [Pigmentibacter ruber]BFD32060.1 Maf family protein [Pigmentibacter ruber]
MNSKQKNKLILASGSPRRKEMLGISGIEFSVIPANIDEAPKKNESGKDYVKRNAFEKAVAVYKNFSQQENAIILSADTIVVTKNDVILEKPLSEEHAQNMLQLLSNDSHLVYTGYTLLQNGAELISRVIETIVTFRKISNEEINAYIASKEPFDKAGGYGIQGKAMGFVTNVNGSYTNVIGLPLAEVLMDLANYANIKPFQ